MPINSEHRYCQIDKITPCLHVNKLSKNKVIYNTNIRTYILRLNHIKAMYLSKLITVTGHEDPVA
jgi:hypothetical protein